MDKRGTLLCLCIGLIYLFIYHQAVFLSPGTHLINDSGDGLKAYFGTAYHVAHDSSYWHFEGMNHPFGDHVHYPDLQPILANSAKLLSTVFPSIADSTVAWVNIYLLLGVLLGFPALFLLFRELGADSLYSIPLAAMAWVLSPQMMRMTGHFGLAHGWVIPTVLLLTIRALKNPRSIRTLLGLLASLLISLWTHPYLAVIAVLPAMALCAWKSIYMGRSMDILKTISILAFPFAVFLLIDGIGPEHPGRNAYPLGFFEHVVHWDNLAGALREERSPLHRFLSAGERTFSIEGLCYLGAGLLLLPAAILLSISLVLKCPKAFFRSNALVLVLFIASLVMLVFAMGYPFKAGMHWHIWNLPLLKEFRSSGRFSWPFYYLVFAVIAVFLSRIKEAGILKKRLTLGLMSICLVFHVYEAHFYQISIGRHVVQASLFDRANPPADISFLQDQSKALQEAGAILPIPFFHFGSEGVRVNAKGSERLSYLSAFHTGMPLMSSSIAKTSIHEARTILSVFTPQGYSTPRISSVHSDDRIAVLKCAPETTPWERQILRAAGIENATSPSIGVQRFGKLQTRLPYSNTRPALKDTVSFNGDTLLFLDFEELDSENPLRGKGSFTSIHNEFEVVAEWYPHPLEVGQEYVLSFWCDASNPLANKASVAVAFEEGPGIGQDWVAMTDATSSMVLHDGKAFVEVGFTCTRTGILTVLSQHYEYFPHSFILDDLLIREISDTVIQKFPDGTSLWNGLIIPSSFDQGELIEKPNRGIFLLGK